MDEAKNVIWCYLFIRYISEKERRCKEGNEMKEKQREGMEGNEWRTRKQGKGSQRKDKARQLDIVCEGTIWIRLQGDMAAKVISQPSSGSTTTARATVNALGGARCTLPQLTLQLFLFKTSVAMSQSISLVWVLCWKPMTNKATDQWLQRYRNIFGIAQPLPTWQARADYMLMTSICQ